MYRHFDSNLLIFGHSEDKKLFVSRVLLGKGSSVHLTPISTRTPFPPYWLLRNFRRILISVHCSVQCAVCSAQCAVRSVQFAVCSSQCAVRNVQRGIRYSSEQTEQYQYVDKIYYTKRRRTARTTDIANMYR